MKKIDISINLPALVGAGVTASMALLSAGSVAGYFYAKKKLIAQYDERLEIEVERTREHLKRLNKVDEYATPEDAARQLMADVELISRPETGKLFDEAVQAMKDYSPDVQVSDETLQEVETEPQFEPRDQVSAGVVSRNVFSANEGIDFDYSSEIAARTKDRPYIISRAEWDDNDHGHEQVELTYYAGDQIVADPNEKEIALVEETVGWDNLRFGHRSGDDEIVYIRHEGYNLDMEVTHHEGKYGEIVAGFTNGAMQT